MNMPDIEIMVDSASRPELLGQIVSTLKKYLKYSGKIAWILHEAVLFSDKSVECVKIGKEAGFDKILVEEAHGQGVSIGSCLRKAQCGYFIHWEDDSIAVRDIPLDNIVKCMDENPGVNQIVFNKRQTMHEVSGWPKKEIVKNNQKLTTSPHWRYTPAIWRVGFILPKWVDFYDSDNSHWQINAELKKKSGHERPDADWIIDNLGVYYWGPIGEEAYVKNIGRGASNRATGIVYK
jgi:hypothetical protein